MKVVLTLLNPLGSRIKGDEDHDCSIVLVPSAGPHLLDIIASSVILETEYNPLLEGSPVNIEIHDAALAARIQKQIQATGSGSIEEVLHRLLETKEEQDRWLLENRETIDAKIRVGIEQLVRGEGIPEDQLDAHLANLKSKI